MAKDAEGMTKMVMLTVTGAASDAEARIAAKTIAENNLVKCSWYGSDPYWGRLLGRRGLGRGRRSTPRRILVAYGGIIVASGRHPARMTRRGVAKHMKQRADRNRGRARTSARDRPG